MLHYNTLIALLGGLTLLTVGCGNASTSTATIQSTASTQISEANSQTAETVEIIGASTPYPAMELLAKDYATSINNIQITFLESSQSSGGIAGVKEGLVDLGTVTRRPKPYEADDNLTHRELAKDALLVAAHPSVEGITNLTTKDLQSIYSGQAMNWQAFGGPDAEIVVLDRAEDTSAKRLLREHYLGPDLGNSPNSIMLRRESDLMEALQNTPYGVGVVSLATFTTNKLELNPLNLDGVAPTPENLHSGKYAMYRSLGIVWYGEPDDKTQGFIDFIFSSKGKDILKEAGFAPTVMN